MRFLGFVFLLLLALGGAAYLTKPDRTAAEAVLREQVLMAVALEDLGEGRSAVENMALAACKLTPSECYELLRASMEITYIDRTVYLEVLVEGFERQATCYGAFGRFFCPGGWHEI